MSRPTLLTQFSLLSLALFIAIGALLGYSLTQSLQEEALNQQKTVVSQLVAPVVGPLIDQKVLANGAADDPKDFSDTYSRIESSLSYIGGAGLVRIKIWNRSGMVIYSDDPKLVGQKYPLSDELQGALDGSNSAQISALQKSENVDERGYGQLLEVYTPLRQVANGPVVGAIEGYYDVQDLENRIVNTSAFLWTSIFTGFLVLYVSLFTIVRNASQRLLRQSRENAMLLADTERKAARLELVNQLARSINRSSLDLEGVFRTALAGIDRIVKHAGAGITLFDEDTGAPLTTVFSTVSGSIIEATGGAGRQGDIGAEKALLEHNDTFITGDTRRGTSAILKELARHNVLSLLVISVRLGERKLGMLRVVSDQPNLFDEDDAAILKGVADQLAVAIENKRLIQETAETTALRETNRLKDEFVSMISHELRTPLASIKGYSRTLLSGDNEWDKATEREFIGIISNESDKLQDLVENLLEMSRIEGGRLPIAPEPLLLRRFCKEVVDRVTPHYPAMQFSCWVENDLPVVEADPRRVEQVMLNLLQNAAKYSGAETVTVRAQNTDNREVLVSVEDNGIGISPEHLPHLFDRFYRAQWNQADSGSGTGLGLAIARALVEAQRGRIWVESALGVGTTFYFTLPSFVLDGETSEADNVITSSTHAGDAAPTIA